MKRAIKPTKPRNPYVMAAAKRAAGVHGRGSGGTRQQARHLLRQEIQRLPPPP